MQGLSPDLLFQTRSGVTPHVLWGVPLSENFFGEKIQNWKEPARKLLYALFRLANASSAKGKEIPEEKVSEWERALKTPALQKKNVERILHESLTAEMLPAGAFPVLAFARCFNILRETGIWTPAELEEWFCRLETAAQDARALSLEKEPLAYLLMAGELPLTLAYELRFTESKLPNSPAGKLHGDANPSSLPSAAPSRTSQIARAKRLEKQAKKVLSETLEDFLDGAGTPKAELLPAFRMLAASWTRMCWLDWVLAEETQKAQKTPSTLASSNPPQGTEHEKTEIAAQSQLPENFLLERKDSRKFFDEDALSNFEWMVRMLIYFTRPDGSQAFTCREKKTAFWCPELFVAALKMDSDRDDKKLAVSVLPELTRKDAEKLEKDLPPCSNNSPWGKSCVMQTSWKARTGAVLTWENEFPKLEIWNRKMPVFSGEWNFRGSWNGEKLIPQTSWRQVFWHSTDEADYVELELKLSENFTLQRQVLLAKDQPFLMLGEALSGDEFHGKKIRTGKLHWESTLPISPGIRMEGAEDSLEHFALCRNGIAGTILPLAFPEWREELAPGNDFAFFSREFDEENETVSKIAPESLSKSALGMSFQTEKSAFFAPIFMDLEPKKLRPALTWHPLSIGEKLQNIPTHKAAAFRIQLDDAQWLVFRSLADSCNRSVLGHNLNSETYIGKFKSDGNCETILEVER